MIDESDKRVVHTLMMIPVAVNFSNGIKEIGIVSRLYDQSCCFRSAPPGTKSEPHDVYNVEVRYKDPLRGADVVNRLSSRNVDTLTNCEAL